MEVYDDTTITKTLSSPTLTSVIKAPKHYIGLRGITDSTMKFFDVRTVINTSNSKAEKIIFPYKEDAQKIRFLTKKDFMAAGNMKDATLFGMDKFVPGQNRSITITEGEFDALSVFQMLGSKYPVVSVRSSTTALDDCKRNRDYLNSFENIYLCLDNDAIGIKASKQIASLFDLNKVFIVNLGPYKDANEMLQAGKSKEFVGAWFAAKKIVPKDIKSTVIELKDILAKEKQSATIDYPFDSLQEMTYGIRPKELVVILAPEKIGKTEFIRTIEHHILKQSSDNIGIVHLEEDEQRSIQGLVGIEMGEPIHLPDCMVSIEDQQKVLEGLVKEDQRLNVYPHFGSDDPNTILDVVRYMVTVNMCKYIFIDHITMLVTGFEGEDERKKLDYLSTKFAELTRELDFTMFLISHVNDDGKTRGSRNITKVADLIISLNRDIEAQDETTRNTTFITVRGNRFAGRTGPAGVLRFDPRTYRLSELKYESLEEIDWPEERAKEAA